MNPDLDLGLDRVIRASPQDVWAAWTTPALLEQWFIPAPLTCRVDRLEAQPGAAFVTWMSEDATAFVPYVDGCFVVVEPVRRLVFTNGLDSRWRPADPSPVAMTAEIVLEEHADGTHYRVVVRHRDPSTRARHEELGFHDGWGAATAQLGRLVEH